MTENNFQIGNVVQLLSGGPYMTINEIDNDRVCCIWFPTKENLSSAFFHKNSLTLIKK